MDGTDRGKQFNFSIPLTTPPGKYLMRIEQFWPTDLYNYSQWFVNSLKTPIRREMLASC